MAQHQLSPALLARLTAEGARAVWLFLNGSVADAVAQLPVSKGILLCQQKPAKVKLTKKVDILHYMNAQKALGKTYQAIVMTSIGAVTPNTWCQITETLAAGGVLCLVAPDDLCSSRLQIHNRFRSHLLPDAEPRLLRRCCDILKRSPSVVVTDRDLTLRGPPPVAAVLPAVPLAVMDSAPADELLAAALAKALTADQKSCVCALVERAKPGAAVAVTAARGRGKSGALGIFAALAALQGRTVFVSAPSAENCQAVFELCRSTLPALGATLKRDQGSGERVKAVNPSGTPFSVAYQAPAQVLSRLADLRGDLVLIVDEAAAVPAPLLKRLVQLCCQRKFALVMASTISGYEGTGRNFSLKTLAALATVITLQVPIRYALGDPLERITNEFFVLDPPAVELAPDDADDVEIVAVHKDALCAGTPDANAWLEKLVALFVDSHYKNSPNDLLLLADCPGHEVLAAINRKKGLVLAALQYAYDGGIEDSEAKDGALSHGDLISWKMKEWHPTAWSPRALGVRIVRVATHEGARRNGLGKRLVEKLQAAIGATKQQSAPKAAVDALFSDKVALLDQTQWLGTSFGLTPALYKFWAACNFRLVHLATASNDITGEVSCIMLCQASPYGPVRTCVEDYRGRMLRTMHMAPEAALEAALAANILTAETAGDAADGAPELQEADWSRLQAYADGRADRAICRAALPVLAQRVLRQRDASALQATLLTGLALQCKSPDTLGHELGLSGEVVLSQVRRAVQALLGAAGSAKRQSSSSAEAGRSKRQAILERYRKNSEKQS